MSNTRTARPRAVKPPVRKPETIKFMGAEYKVADKIGVWPQMQLARAAERGIMLSDPRGLAAVHATLQNVIHPDDWGRFEDDMINKKVDDLGELLQTVSQAMRIVIARQGQAAPDTNGASGNGKADAAVPGMSQKDEQVAAL